MSLIKYTRNTDGTYGPTKNNNYYISKADHRKTASPKKGKTRWKIEEGQEFHVFNMADEPLNVAGISQLNWFCNENNCIFGFVYLGDDMITLGENGEVIAKFPNDRNINDPWHGYPVSTEETQNRPSSELLDTLEQSGKLTFEYRIKIEKGRI